MCIEKKRIAIFILFKLFERKLETKYRKIENERLEFNVCVCVGFLISMQQIQQKI